MELFQLLPEDILLPGENHEKIKPIREYSSTIPLVKSFDLVL
jgi:hypothetical protein